jgi:hypothetical protein
LHAQTRGCQALGLSVALSACGAFGQDSSTATAPEPVTDASVPLDAGGADATPADGGATSRGCATPHTFCDDFDQGGVGDKWQSSVFGSYGSLALDATKAVSMPNALLATLTTFSTPGSLVGQYVQTELGPFTQLTCTWQMLVEKLPSAGLPDFIDVNVGSATPTISETSFVLSGDTNETRLSVFQQPGNFQKYPKSAALPVNTWLAASVVMTPAGGIRVQVGELNLSDTLPLPPFPNAKVRIRLGLSNVAESDGARVRYDDFACDITAP